MQEYEFDVYGFVDDSPQYAFVKAATAAQDDGWEVIGVTHANDRVLVFCRRPIEKEEEIKF